MYELENRIEQLESQLKEMEAKKISSRRNWFWFFMVLLTFGLFDIE
jgi:hypothetical protein